MRNTLKWLVLAIVLSAPVAGCSKCDFPTWDGSFPKWPGACHSDNHVQ